MRCQDIEVLLSGYIDNELTQQQVQRVEVHLESCGKCRTLLDQMKEAQLATRELELSQPSLQEWIVMEKRILEQGGRSVGWAILIVWLAVTVGYATFNYATSPTEPLFQKILVFGLFLGLALLFLSVLLERLRESRTDRYKEVHK